MSQNQQYENPYPAQQGAGWAEPGYATDQVEPDPTVLVVAWVCAVLTSGYMLPWAIAVTRKRPDHVSIALVNVLLGWTVVGWIVALVMAMRAHRVFAAPRTVQDGYPGSTGYGTPNPAPGWYASPTEDGHRYWDGTAWTGHRAH